MRETLRGTISKKEITHSNCEDGVKMDNFRKKKEDWERLTVELIANLKASLVDLEALWTKYESSRRYEDPVYRFYHQSYKVFELQDYSVEIVEALRSLLPGRQINSKFQTILDEGTGKEFELADNDRWLDATRPIVEAFFHTRFFLEMAIKYGKELDEPPTTMPSGWSALLYLFDLR